MSINNISNIKTFGKFLDQPMLIAKFDKVLPKALILGSALYIAKEGYDTYKKTQKIENEVIKKEKNKQNKKDIIQKSIIMMSAVASACLAPKIASKLTNRTTIDNLDSVIKKNSELIDDFTNNFSDKLNNETIELLERAKSRTLSFFEVKKLTNSLNDKKGKEFMSKLIPEPQNIKAKDIFSEIGYLSIYGAVPVIGGIVGGEISDKIVNEKNRKEKTTNRISEGIYQYLANIFMCNIGAGAALAILEKNNINSKSMRAIGMISGIILTGVIGGSKIANFISDKIINPILSPDKKIKERKPEAMDLFMHSDDIATVSVLSGLKWIEPALPVLYSISGYKAGIGYRN